MAVALRTPALMVLGTARVKEDLVVDWRKWYHWIWSRMALGLWTRELSWKRHVAKPDWVWWSDSQLA